MEFIRHSQSLWLRVKEQYLIPFFVSQSKICVPLWLENLVIWAPTGLIKLIIINKAIIFLENNIFNEGLMNSCSKLFYIIFLVSDSCGV